jgi:hypothetical protein
MADDAAVTEESLEAQFLAGEHEAVLDACDKELKADGIEKERAIMLRWRAARACFDMSDRLPVSDKAGKEAMLRRGLSHADECIALDPEAWLAHKWYVFAGFFWKQDSAPWPELLALSFSLAPFLRRA